MEHKIEFCIKLTDQCNKNIKQINTGLWKSSSFSSTGFYMERKTFLNSLEIVEDKELCSGQPVTSWTEKDMTKMRTLIRSD